MTLEALLPVALALAAACLFGVSSVIAKRGLAHIDAQTGSLISIATVTALRTDPSGGWSGSLPLPAVAALVGQRLRLQAALLDAGPALGLTNGLEVVLR